MPWISTNVPAIASMRRRLFSGASSEIISSSTHIEHGLKPSSRPIASVKAGSPTSSSVRVRPKRETSNDSGGAADLAPVCGHARLSSASQVPASAAAADAARPAKALRISLSVLASSEYPMISCPPTYTAGTRAAPAPCVRASSLSRSSADGSF